MSAYVRETEPLEEVAEIEQEAPLQARKQAEKQQQRQQQQQESPSLSTKDRPHLRSHLISLVQGMTDLINTRDFSFSSWEPFLAPSFRGTPDPPFPPLNAPPREYLVGLQQRSLDNPHWQVRPLDSSTQFRGMDGEVFLNCEALGVPQEGIVTRSFLVFTFREGRWGKKRGVWRCVGFVGAHGGTGLEGVG